MIWNLMINPKNIPEIVKLGAIVQFMQARRGGGGGEGYEPPVLRVCEPAAPPSFTALAFAVASASSVTGRPSATRRLIGQVR